MHKEYVAYVKMSFSQSPKRYMGTETSYSSWSDASSWIKRTLISKNLQTISKVRFSSLKSSIIPSSMFTIKINDNWLIVTYENTDSDHDRPPFKPTYCGYFYKFETIFPLAYNLISQNQNSNTDIQNFVYQNLAYFVASMTSQRTSVIMWNGQLVVHISQYPNLVQ